MPTLRITITAPLSDEPLEAFRERHEIEAAVLAMLESLSDEPREISVASEIEADAPAPGGLAVVRRRPGRPAKAKPAANGEAVGQTAPEAA